MGYKKSRRLYYLNKFNNCENDSKKTWSGINDILNRKNRDNNIVISSHDNIKHTGKEAANLLNNYFTNYTRDLVSGFPSNIDYEYFSFIPQSLESCFLIPTNEIEVDKVLKDLPNKGNVIYDIRPNLLKRVSSYILPIIVFIFNMCLDLGEYPNKLKLARVVPVYKGDSKNDAKNYRPISNLSVFNKIFEILIYNRFLCFVENKNILSNLQYGFRKSSNTTLAIFDFVSDVLTTFNKKSYTIALYLDLKHAFDTIDKDILLFKLDRYGLRGRANNLISSYLTNRTQYVDISNKHSELNSISLGVPQGSVLGPLLFNLFINDVTIAIPYNKILYADDGVFYVNDLTLEGCLKKLRNLIELLSEWLSFNKLIPNTNKTKLMLFTSHFLNLRLPDVYFNGRILEWVNSMRYLGIIIDNRLNFSLQADMVLGKLSRLHGIFYAISNILPQATLFNLYNSLVY